MYCLCVNVYCHLVTTQLQLINISYHKVPFVQEAGWAVGWVSTGAEKSHPPPGFDPLTIMPIDSRCPGPYLCWR